MQNRYAQVCAVMLAIGLGLYFAGGRVLRPHNSIALAAAPQAEAPMKTPADGYTVHVSAPHLVNGHVMGPYHHYCKVMSPEPIIVCQIYDTTDANATLTQIEF